MLELLLKDQTTGRNIIWANGEHDREEIQIENVKLILPRYEKLREKQRQRTKDRAEIFTPPEVCKLQNDLIIGDERDWQAYVDAKFLEITCGEAPYLVNRYNAVTGEPIPIAERVGLLDRKLHVVSKETAAVADWMDWTIRAVQSIYGYEFQGDNLYLARRNVFETVKDYYAEKFQRELNDEIFLITIATVISCNLWQMDGLTNAPPFTDARPEVSLFDDAPQGEIFCLIMDWRTREVKKFRDLAKGGRR